MADNLSTQKKLSMSLDEICKQRQSGVQKDKTLRKGRERHAQGQQGAGGSNAHGRPDRHQHHQHQQRKRPAMQPDHMADKRHKQGHATQPTHIQRLKQQQAAQQHRHSLKYTQPMPIQDMPIHHNYSKYRSVGFNSHGQTQAVAPAQMRASMPNNILYEDDFTYLEGGYGGEDDDAAYMQASAGGYLGGLHNQSVGMAAAGLVAGYSGAGMYSNVAGLDMSLDNMLLNGGGTAYGMGALTGVRSRREGLGDADGALDISRQYPEAVRSYSEEEDYRAGYQAGYLGADSPRHNSGAVAAARQLEVQSSRPANHRRLEDGELAAKPLERQRQPEQRQGGSDRHRQERDRPDNGRSRRGASPRGRRSRSRSPPARRSRSRSPPRGSARGSRPEPVAAARTASGRGAARQPSDRPAAGTGSGSAAAARAPARGSNEPAPRSRNALPASGSGGAAAVRSAAAAAPSRGAGGAQQPPSASRQQPASAANRPGDQRRRIPAPVVAADPDDDQEYSPERDDVLVKAERVSSGGAAGQAVPADPRRGSGRAGDQQQGHMFDDGGFIAPPTSYREAGEAGDDLFSLRTVVRPDGGVVERREVPLEDVAAAVLGINSVLTRDAVAAGDPPVVLSLRHMLKLRDRMEMGELPAAADCLGGRQPNQQAVLCLSERIVRLAAQAREMTNMLEYGRDIKDSTDSYSRQYGFILHQLRNHDDWGEIFMEVPQFYSLSREDQQTVLGNLQRRKELRAMEVAAAAATGMAGGAGAAVQQ